MNLQAQITVLIFSFLLFGCGTPVAIAAEPSLPPAKYTDPVKQVAAEIEMAMVYISELGRCFNKLDKEPAKPEELAKREQEFRNEVNDTVSKEVTQSGGNPIPVLEKERDILLNSINDVAASAAARFRLGEPEPVTVGSLRAAINDEKMRVVPICSGTPAFRGVLSGDKYTSPRNWFSVQLPTSSNLFRVPFSIKDDSLNTPDANYDLVTFSVKDFGELLIAGVDYFPADFIEKRMKPDDHRTVLSKLSNMALNIARHGQGFPTKPKVIEEGYLSTPYGEALLRVYMVEKGSLLVRIKGGENSPPVAETFDTLIAVIVAMQKNNFIYVIAENDAERDDLPTDSKDSNKETLKKRVQSFFASVLVHRQ